MWLIQECNPSFAGPLNPEFTGLDTVARSLDDNLDRGQRHPGQRHILQRRDTKIDTDLKSGCDRDAVTLEETLDHGTKDECWSLGDTRNSSD